MLWSRFNERARPSPTQLKRLFRTTAISTAASAALGLVVVTNMGPGERFDLHKHTETYVKNATVADPMQKPASARADFTAMANDGEKAMGAACLAWPALGIFMTLRARRKYKNALGEAGSPQP